MSSAGVINWWPWPSGGSDDVAAEEEEEELRWRFRCNRSCGVVRVAWFIIDIVMFLGYPKQSLVERYDVNKFKRIELWNLI